MDEILRAIMTDLSTKTEKISVAWAGYGGRSLTSATLVTEIPPACYPLGQHNKRVFVPGLLTGISTSNPGRLSACAKSSFAGTIKESNSGGIAARLPARLGDKGSIVRWVSREDTWCGHGHGGKVIHVC